MCSVYEGDGLNPRLGIPPAMERERARASERERESEREAGRERERARERESTRARESESESERGWAQTRASASRRRPRSISRFPRASARHKSDSQDSDRDLSHFTRSWPSIEPFERQKYWNSFQLFRALLCSAHTTQSRFRPSCEHPVVN